MRIAVLGVGSIGMRHLRNLRSLGETDLHAYDADIAAQERLIAEGGAAVYGTNRDLWLAKPEVALICTPPQYHVGNALEAIRNGVKAVFIEKALSDNISGVDALIDYAAREGVITMVAVNMRYHIGVATLKQLYDASVVGDAIYARLHAGSYLPAWPAAEYRRDCGAILDVGAHEVDVATWLFGTAKLRHAVARPASSLGLSCDGMAEMFLEHDSGVLSSVHVNIVQRNYHRSIEVVGTKGTLWWDWDAARVVAYNENGGPFHDVFYGKERAADMMYVSQMSHFLRHVRDGTPTGNDVAQAARVLRLLMEAKKA